MSTTTTTNYGWVIPNDSELVKDGAAAIRTLGNSADASLKTVSDASISKSFIDAKGDLIVGSADNTIARLAVGTNNQVLLADSTATNGIKWGDAPAGGMTLLSTTNLSGTSTTVSGISQSYKDLLVLVQGGYFNAGASPRIKPNNSASTGTVAKIYGSGVQIGNAIDFNGSGGSWGTSLDPRNFAYMYITDYTNGTYSKPVRCFFTGDNTCDLYEGTMYITSAITSIVITSTSGTSSFSGGQVLIYGVK